MHGIKREYRDIEGITGVYKGLQRITRDIRVNRVRVRVRVNRVLQGYTRVAGD